MCYAGGAGFGMRGGYLRYHERLQFFEVDVNVASIITWKRVEWIGTNKKIDQQVILYSGRLKLN